MPIGTPFHPRVEALCESRLWRDWAGFFAVSSYEVSHEREYNAIRNAAALIDISPLFKYRLTGKHAGRLVDRVLTRDATKIAVGQVVYTSWCDGEGKAIDDGTVSRLGDTTFRWTAAEPNLRWLRESALGLEVQVEDVSDRTAAVALQGPTSRDILKACVEGDVAALKYFRVGSFSLAGLTDLLDSFTYIPGTVLQLGYGSLYDRTEWVEGEYRDADKGYKRWMGPRWDYAAGFRRGYEAGYRRAYAAFRPGGRDRRGHHDRDSGWYDDRYRRHDDWR